ncbi:hypothetical protein ACWDZW_38950, partial [Streptomyces coeruleorubidus]
HCSASVSQRVAVSVSMNEVYLKGSLASAASKARAGLPRRVSPSASSSSARETARPRASAVRPERAASWRPAAPRQRVRPRPETASTQDYRAELERRR